MKRFFNYSFLWGLLVMISTSCRDTSPKDGYMDTFTEGVIPVAIDESLRPVIDLEIDVFEGLNIAAEINPIYCSEVRAIDLLLKDSVRVAITTRMLSSNEHKVFDAKGYRPRQEMLAIDGIALIINKENVDSVIAVPQLRKILTGEITHWNQLYPSSTLGEINVAFDNTNSSTVRYAQDSICRGQPFAKQRIYAQKTNLDVFDYVSKTRNAIGVIGVSWLENSADTTNLSFKAGVRVMEVCAFEPIDTLVSYKPYQAYLALRTYPLTRDLFVICSDPRQGLSTHFSAFLTGDKGQRIILKTGLVPATQPLRLVQIKSE